MQYTNREPDLNESLDALFRAHLAELHTALPAVVIAYDAKTQRAQVKPVFQRVYLDEDGIEQVIEYPVLQDVPVHFPRGGGAFIHLPLAKDDLVLLVCSQRSLDVYLQGDGKTVHDVADARMHHVSDAIAFVGLSTTQNVPQRLQSISADDAKDLIIGLEDGSAELHFQPGGKVYIRTAGSGNSSFKDDALVRKSDLAKLVKWLNQTLLPAIKVLTVPTAAGPSGVPINVASFTNAPDATASSIASSN